MNDDKTVGAVIGRPPEAETSVEATGNRQQAIGNRQQATGNRQQATGDRQQATGNRQQATGDRQQATGNRQQATGDGGNGLPRPSGPRNDAKPVGADAHIGPRSDAEKRPEKQKPEPGQSWVTRFFYPIIHFILAVALRIYHWPTFRGRENLPEGACVLCANHSGFADPLWVFQLLGVKILPWTMAKKSVMDTPVLGPFLRTFRAFPVDRDNPDMAAIKKAFTVLKNGEKLLIFPEGTRVKNGKKSEPKSGAVMVAQRVGVPLVPIYITHGRKPFQPIKVIMGEAYTPEWSCRRPDSAELEEKTTELMGKIYALGK